MITAVLTWLGSTRLGRWLHTAAIATAGIALAAAVGFARGQANARQKSDRKSLDAVRERRASDERIDAMQADDRRKRLGRDWGR